MPQTFRTSFCRLSSAMAWLAGAWLALATVAAAGDPLSVIPAQSAGPALLAPSVPPDAPLTTGTSYWIVSSRHASQHRLQRSPYGLAYCRKQEDGRLVASDAAALQAELHYTNNLDGQEVIVAGPNSLTRLDNNALNATLGLAWLCDCWSVTPAVVVPLLDSPDRYFDYEFSFHVNRWF